MAFRLNHTVGSVLASLFFTLGWWLLIDGVVYTSHQEPPQPVLEWYEYIPAVGVSIFLFMINLVSLDHLQPNQFEIFQTSNNGPLLIKVWLFIWSILSFAAIGGAIAIMALKYTAEAYLGAVIIVQPILVFIGALIWLFSRRTAEEQSDPMGM